MRSRALMAAFAAVGLFAVANPAAASAQTQNENTKPGKVVVQKGDSLSKIAKARNTTFIRLFDANQSIKHPDVIYPGQEIRVPAADEKIPSRPLPGAAAIASPKKAVAPARKTQPARTVSYSAPSNAGVWDRLAQCESGGNWSINTGNGYYGGLQFSLSSWRGVGGSGYPHQASKSEQIARAEMLKARQGWGAWPACSYKLGLR